MRRIWRHRRGVASVEMAITTLFVLAPLCAGVADLGVMIATWARMNRAQEAAITYAWSNPAATAAAIQSAASGMWGAAAPTLSVKASTACYCISPTGTRQSGTPVGCSGSCGNSQVLAGYVTTTLSTAVTLVAPLPGTASPYPISTTATVRVQ